MKVPDIVTESGRAIAAPHSMLVVEVFERINKHESLGKQHQPKSRHNVVDDLAVLLKNNAKLGRLERFHDRVGRTHKRKSPEFGSADCAKERALRFVHIKLIAKGAHSVVRERLASTLMPNRSDAAADSAPL